MAASLTFRFLNGAISLLLFMTIAGCALVDEEVMLRPVSDVPPSSIGQGQRVALNVVDERSSTLIGERGPDGTADIRSVQDARRVVDDVLNQGLQNQGFVPVQPTAVEPVTLKVELRELRYDVADRLPLPEPRVNAVLKVVAQNGDRSFEQLYRAQTATESFLPPTAAEDSQLINRALSDVIDRILTDRQLLEFLAEPQTTSQGP